MTLHNHLLQIGIICLLMVIAFFQYWNWRLRRAKKELDDVVKYQSSELDYMQKMYTAIKNANPNKFKVK